MKLARNGTLKSRLIFILALVLSLVLVAFFHYINRLNNELDRQEDKTQILMPKVEQSEQVLKRIEANEPKISQLNEDIVNLTTRLINKNDVSAMIDVIHQVSLIKEVDIQSIALKDETVKPFYSELPMHLEVVGEYPALLQFLNSLQGLKSLIGFGNFTIEALNESIPNHLKLYLEAKLFLSKDKLQAMQSVVSLPAHTLHQAIASNLRNPFEPRTRHIIAINILQSDSDNLERKNQIFYKGSSWSVWVE